MHFLHSLSLLTPGIDEDDDEDEVCDPPVIVQSLIALLGRVAHPST